MIVAISATSALVVFFGQLAVPGVASPTIPALAGIIVVISPIWLGFYVMSSRVATPPLPWLAQILLASVITAAIAVWVLPEFLRWLLIMISNFENFGLAPHD